MYSETRNVSKGQGIPLATDCSDRPMDRHRDKIMEPDRWANGQTGTKLNVHKHLIRGS